MMLLGIDYGRKRIGLAVCSLLKIATPLKMLNNADKEKTFLAIKDIINEHDIEEVVVGLPKNMDNSLGEMAEETKSFALQIQERFDIKVHLWDERLTSIQAERSMLSAGLSRNKRKKSRDQIAATLMLQSYADSTL